MKLFPPDTFLVHRISLKGDISLVSYWDLDDHGRPSLFGQFVRIGNGELLPLKVPILDFRPPTIDGQYEKREFAHLLEENAEKRRPYLDRAGNVLAKQLESVILTGNPYYFPKHLKEPTQDAFLSDAFKRFALLVAFIFGNGGDDEDEKEKHKPP